jgi:CBS domain containing-hemolysin-like protein
MGNKAAKTVEMLHNEPERFYSVTQVGITLVSLGLGAFGMETISTLTDPSFVALFAFFGNSQAIQTAAHTASYAFAFIVISFLHVVAGELAPKVLAFHKAEAISMAVGWAINLLYLIFKPLIYIMKLSSSGLLWISGSAIWRMAAKATSRCRSRKSAWSSPPARRMGSSLRKRHR